MDNDEFSEVRDWFPSSEFMEHAFSEEQLIDYHLEKIEFVFTGSEFQEWIEDHPIIKQYIIEQFIPPASAPDSCPDNHFDFYTAIKDKNGLYTFT